MTGQFCYASNVKNKQKNQTNKKNQPTGSEGQFSYQ